ncbi:MAG: hypothetical protein ACI4F9_03835 [Lachnospiraceae bacterium]
MKKKWMFYAIIFVFIMSFSLGGQKQQVKAATAVNVMQSKKADSGKWVAKRKGYQYKYNKSGTYAKNVWRNIGGYIYCFKSDGYLQTGWKTYQGYKYYFNTQGKLVTGWQKISNYYYYFDKKSGKMVVNTVVDNYKIDKNGKRGSKISSTNKKDVDIFVGDSRTVGMSLAVGNEEKCIAKVGQGYNWFITDAQKSLETRLKKNPTATVVFALGVNDVHNVSKYIAKYKSLQKEYPKAKFFYLAVNPVNSNYKNHASLTPKILNFNKNLKAEFKEKYIDTYNYLIKEKFESRDGLHYSNSTYNKLYKFILDEVAKR